MGGMDEVDLREWKNKKEEGGEENRETRGPNSLPSPPPVLSPFFLLVTPSWDQQIGEFNFRILPLFPLQSAFLSVIQNVIPTAASTYPQSSLF